MVSQAAETVKASTQGFGCLYKRRSATKSFSNSIVHEVAQAKIGQSEGSKLNPRLAAADAAFREKKTFPSVSLRHSG